MGKKKGAEKLAPSFAMADEDDAAGLGELIKSDPTVINTKNKDGWTPLHQAAYAGSNDCISLLLKAGADPVARCRDGDLPVHYAAAQGHSDAIQALVAAGGARMLTASDNDGETPADVALNAKVKRLIENLASTADADDGDDVDDEEDVE